MLFEHDNKIFPLSAIKSCATEHNTTTIVLDNGDVLKSNGFYTADRIAAMAATFVPALPGYFKISIPEQGVVMDDDWPVVPIVAWRIVGQLNYAEPIALKINGEISTRYAVLCPNGEVHEPGGEARYKSIKEFFKIMNWHNATQTVGPRQQRQKRRSTLKLQADCGAGAR
jgi:hypothetical protein